MGISNNRLFFRDSITDGWTKKDWVLNLIPLGGIVSVAYDMGSACLSSRDRTAKFSEDFFKSLIQTTLKKIAQCLWVPIVVCGALKLVCLMVNACWNRCFPAKIGLCEIIPSEVVVHHIFPYLNLHELGVSRRVSKRWSQIAIPPILWQSAIYREIAFSSKNWAKLNAEFIEDVDMRQEMLSLPKNIAEELRRSAFPGKSIRETHVLVRMPKGLTLKKLGQFAKKHFPNSTRRWRYTKLDKLGAKPAVESIWLLMTKDLLPETRSKSYGLQVNIIAELAKRTQVSYELPTTLEAATCMFAKYTLFKNRQFNDDRLHSYTRCQDDFKGYQVFVGGDDPTDLRLWQIKVNYNFVGVAPLRKF